MHCTGDLLEQWFPTFRSSWTIEAQIGIIVDHKQLWRIWSPPSVAVHLLSASHGLSERMENGPLSSTVVVAVGSPFSALFGSI